MQQMGNAENTNTKRLKLLRGKRIILIHELECLKKIKNYMFGRLLDRDAEMVKGFVNNTLNPIIATIDDALHTEREEAVEFETKRLKEATDAAQALRDRFQDLKEVEIY